MNPEQHQKVREEHFRNENLIITVLHAVCGGVLYAGLAQASALIKLAGEYVFLMFITLAAIALLGAVLSTYWKHQYKMWDMKSPVTPDPAERERRRIWAEDNLTRMRRAMLWTVLLLALSISQFLVAAWWRLFT